MVSPDAKRKLQVFLVITVAIVAARTAYIFYERKQAESAPPKVEQPLNADDYVTLKKLHAYDLKSARALTQSPAWVKEGYRYTYYPFDAARGHAGFAHEAGLLGPIEKLQITDVMLDTAPQAPEQKQIMAVFEKEGKRFAFPIGAAQGTDFQIYADEMLFLQDPRELYHHWPAEVWDAIEKHEVRPGMNELQTDFAIGFGALVGSGLGYERVLKYPNGGKPLTVTFHGGKAAVIQPGP
jgi:hypothetical protein